ncbi:MAG: hypothetical protein Fur0041_09780 [Bacteroidia bacterium]
MKTIYKVLFAAALITGLASCKMTGNLSKQDNGDDVYYSLKDAKRDHRAEKKRLEDEEKRRQEEAKLLQQKENEKKLSSRGSDYYEEPFDYDDYYDYEYAARLRRFNHPMNGCGYYGNYYTNSYFYNYNPYYYGTSVYMGYNFWGPSYMTYSYCPSSYWYYNNGWGWGTGWYGGWGSPWGMYYDPWYSSGWGYNPYYYSYYPYWGYGGGWYGPGYGLINNYYVNNYYYNSFDNNSYFYGPRTSPGSHDGRATGTDAQTWGERFVNQVAADNHLDRPTQQDINRIVGVVPASNTGLQPSRPDNNTNPSMVNPVTRPVEQPSVTPNRTDVQPSNPANTGRGNVPPTPPAPDFNRPTQNPQTPPSGDRPKISAPNKTESNPEVRPRMSERAPSSGGNISFPSGGNNNGGRNSSSGNPVSRPR